MSATAAAPNGDESMPQPPIGRLGEVLLILLVFFVIAGDPVPHNNEPHYLCRLKHFWDPTWCRGDVFLESPDAHGLFVWLFGWVTIWLSLPTTAWVGRILAWTCLAWAWQRLSWRLVPLPLSAVLSAALWVTLIETSHLAGEWVVGGVEAKCFAYVFVLLALRELVDRRWNRAWISLGAATAIHVLVGGWSLVIFCGIWLLDPLRGTRTGPAFFRAVRSMLPGLVLGGLLSLLGIVPALALTWNETPELIAEANQIYVFERLPHHLALLTLPQSEMVLRFTLHGLLILAFWLLARVCRSNHINNRGLRTIMWYAGGAVLLALSGLAIEFLCWNEPQLAAKLLRYYWFRLTDVAVPLAVSLQVVSLIAWGFAQRKSGAVWGLAVAIWLTSLLIGVKTVERLIRPIPPADRQMADHAAWVNACDWIRDHTPPDATFLTPRLANSFKWRTGRPEVVTRKDIPQDARSMVAWFERLQNVFYYNTGSGEEPTNTPGQLGTERAVAMARRYGAAYIVSDHNHPLVLPVVYPNRKHPNDTYVVYAVED